MVGSFENGNGLSDFIESRESDEQLSDYWLPKKGFASWNSSIIEKPSLVFL
jgi:hypothetical protein